MDDSLGLSFSITPHCPNPVLLLVWLCIPAPSLTSAPVGRQLSGTSMQKHGSLAAERSRGEQGAIESRMVAFMPLCVVLKLSLLNDNCSSPGKSNGGCERFESTVVDGDGLNLHLQRI
ncbi:hypothetical protein TURU_049469 [Turdus rufiventris]|nr:hypothetical protein TURU_049469 [Turdus rufiventris]